MKHFIFWNKVAIGKLLWAWEFKKDKLWVQWVHAYYLKGKLVGQGHLPKSAS